jgi:uncharacterized Zn finger protein (UPF0148 family)
MESPVYICPVCGYKPLLEQPWDGDMASFGICPSCGTQFGYQDFAADSEERSYRHQELRAKWIERGMPWHGVKGPPENWNPQEQLKAVQ